MGTIATTTTLAAGLPRYYDRRLLAMAKPILVHYQIAQKGKMISLPNGTGHTVYWTRYLPIPKRITALTETTTGGITRVDISDMQVTAQAKLYGHIAQVGRYVDLIHIDQNIANRVDLLARNMGESLDYIIMDATHGGDHAINRIRIDNDASYTFEATSDSGSSTLLIVDASISSNTGSTDDYWNNGFAICTDETSKAYGEVRLISDYTHASGTITVGTAFSADMDEKKYRVVASDGLATTTDNMSTAGVRYSVRELKRKKALKFADGSFVAIMPIDTELIIIAQSKLSYMLESPKIYPYLLGDNEENKMDNQQERLSFWKGWLSGIIDGEGTITVVKRHMKGNKLWCKPVIAIQNTSKYLLITCQNVMKQMNLPCYLSKGGYKYKDERRDVYTWRVDGLKRCKRFLDEFVEFLVVKKLQGELLSEFIKSRLEVYPNVPYTQKQIDLVDKIRKLNHRGKLESSTTNTLNSRNSTEDRVWPV